MDKVTYRTTKSELVKVALPEESRTYKPIGHEQLINLTLNSIQGAGFELEKEWYQSAREGQIATGHYAIRNIADKEMQLQIGWQNSYNKQVSLKFALGVHVFICSNGACSSDMGNFKRKHTGDVQEFTPKTIEEYIHTAGEAFIQMQAQRDRMKEIQLSKRVQGELLGRMYIEEDFIESTQLNIIKREISKPTHDYGVPNSLWEMYQFTTYSMRDIHPSFWMKNHLAANSFFVNESGLFIPKVEPIVISVEEGSPNQVSMYDVPEFDDNGNELPPAETVDEVAIIEEVVSSGIEITNPIEEEDEPKFGPSDVDHTAILNGDSKLDVKLPATMSEAFDASIRDVIKYDEETGEITITTTDQTTDYSDLM